MKKRLEENDNLDDQFMNNKMFDDSDIQSQTEEKKEFAK